MGLLNGCGGLDRIMVHRETLMNLSKSLLTTAALMMCLGTAFAQTAGNSTQSTSGQATTAAQAAAPAKQVIRLQDKVGDTWTYKIDASMSIQGSVGDFTGLTKITVVKVDGDLATVKTSESQMVVSFGGQTINVPDSPEQYEVHDSTGRVTSIKGEDVGPNNYRMTALSSMVFPSNAIGVGDSWTIQYPADPKLGGVAAVAKFKVIGTEVVGGVDCLKISVDASELSGDTPGSSVGTTWVNPKTGLQVKAEAEWENFPVPSSPMPVSGHFTMELVPAMSGGKTTSTATAGS